ncbi:hypothetical protein EV356DRAFT_513587 [Viridothelium virens]|uniref:Uncharacterized protein n=1 Tax=Viridothelium virens TaxID=1048519 RepID=A0A6A6HC43_VIRVR|nr:hypothetical protein EV356DRAFT_513587 [Viridothelium virens]
MHFANLAATLLLVGFSTTLAEDTLAENKLVRNAEYWRSQRANKRDPIADSPVRIDAKAGPWTTMVVGKRNFEQSLMGPHSGAIPDCFFEANGTDGVLILESKKHEWQTQQDWQQQVIAYQSIGQVLGHGFSFKMTFNGDSPTWMPPDGFDPSTGKVNKEKKGG